MIAEVFCLFRSRVKLESSHVFGAQLAICLLSQIDQVNIVIEHLHKTLVLSVVLSWDRLESNFLQPRSLVSHARLLSRGVSLLEMLRLVSVLLGKLSHYATLSEHDGLGVVAWQDLHRMTVRDLLSIERLLWSWLRLLPPRDLLGALGQKHRSQVLVCHFAFETLSLQEALDLAVKESMKAEVSHNC